jgi:TonB-dependent SusC/RagA subfamily outer membrane receptor
MRPVVASAVLPRWLAATACAAALLGCGGNPGRQSRPQPLADSTRANSTAGVTAQDIESHPGEPIEKILANRVSGVVVSRSAEGYLVVQIRGTSTFNSSTEPLYVIDGVPVSPGPGGALAGINPYDIESIRVLKDAASTAEYGSRGANGVIVIKLKRPGVH